MKITVTTSWKSFFLTGCRYEVTGTTVRNGLEVDAIYDFSNYNSVRRLPISFIRKPIREWLEESVNYMDWHEVRPEPYIFNIDKQKVIGTQRLLFKRKRDVVLFKLVWG